MALGWAPSPDPASLCALAGPELRRASLTQELSNYLAYWSLWRIASLGDGRTVSGYSLQLNCWALAGLPRQGLNWEGDPGWKLPGSAGWYLPTPTPHPQQPGLGGGGLPGAAQGGEGSRPHLPLLVSLSLIRKEPALLIGARSCLSASFRLIDLKNHLGKKRRQASLRERPCSSERSCPNLPPKLYPSPRK